MFQEKNQILWNKNIGPSYYNIGIKCCRGYSEARPGQFVMLRFGDRADPLLRRPFSIHRLIESDNAGVEGIELLYKVVGPCTKALSMHEKGEITDLLGPLGNHFSVPDNARRIFIVAGGIGVAPMVFLTSFLRKKGIAPSECMVFIGGRSEDDLLCRNHFAGLGMPVCVTTDDGSAGKKGLITDALVPALKENRPDMIYACGPEPMLRAVSHIAETEGLPCQISIETLMACGMGACLGCAVESKREEDRYFHTCVDGPVFDAEVVKGG